MTSSAGTSGLMRVASPPRSRHRVAHRGEVDDRGHAGEVLHDHAGGGEGDLLAGLRVRVPGRQRLDVLLRDGAVAFGAEEVLEQDLEAEGQAGDVVGGLQGVESEDVEFAVADAQLGAGVEAVVGHAPDVTSGGSATRRRRVVRVVKLTRGGAGGTAASRPRTGPASVRPRCLRSSARDELKRVAALERLTAERVTASGPRWRRRPSSQPRCRERSERARRGYARDRLGLGRVLGGRRGAVLARPPPARPSPCGGDA